MSLLLIQELQHLCLHPENQSLIGTDIIVSDVGVIKRSWNTIKAALEALYGRVLSSLKQITWRVIVESGKIPIFFDTLLNALKRIPLATSEALLKLTRIVAANLNKFWNYFETFFELSADQKQAKEETLHFNWIASSAAGVFRVITDELSSVFSSVVFGLADLLYNAIEGVTGIFFSFLEIASNTNDALKSAAIEYSFFYMSVISDTSFFSQQRSVFAEKHVGVLARNFAKFAEQVKSTWQENKDSITSSSVDLGKSLLFGTFIAGSFTATENVVNWIYEHLSWLILTLRQITSVALQWLKSIIFITPLMVRSIGPFIEEIAIAMEPYFSKTQEPVNFMQQQHQLLKQLSQNNTLPDEERKLLASVVETSEKSFYYMAEKKKAYNSAKWAMNDNDALADKMETAKLVTYLCTSNKTVQPLTAEIAKTITSKIEQQLNVPLDEAIKLTNTVEFLESIALLKTFESIDNTKLSNIGVGGDDNNGKTEISEEEMDLLKKRERFEREKRVRLLREALERDEDEERVRQESERYSRIPIEKLEDAFRVAMTDYELSMKALAKFDQENAIIQSDELLLQQNNLQARFEDAFERKRVNLGPAYEMGKSIVPINENTAVGLLMSSEQNSKKHILQAQRYALFNQVLVKNYNMNIVGEVLNARRTSSPIAVPFTKSRISINILNWKIIGAGLLLLADGALLMHSLNSYYTWMTSLVDSNVPEPWFFAIGSIASGLGFKDLFNGEAFSSFAASFSGGLTSAYHANRVTNLFVMIGSLSLGFLAILGYIFFLQCMVLFAIIDVISGRDLGTVIKQYASRGVNRGIAAVLYLIQRIVGVWVTANETTQAFIGGATSLIGAFVGISGVESAYGLFQGVQRRYVYQIPILPSVNDILQMLPPITSIFPVENEFDLMRYKPKILSEELKRFSIGVLREKSELAKTNTTEMVARLQDADLPEDLRNVPNIRYAAPSKSIQQIEFIPDDDSSY